MKPFPAIVAACLIAIGAPTAALAERYACEITPTSDTTMMPPQFLIENHGNGQATVAHSWIDGPLQHSVAMRTNGARQEFSFQAQTRISGRYITLNYSAVVFTGRGQMVINLQPGAGWQGAVRGSYACRQV